MSGETGVNVSNSAWTIESLFAYFSQLIDAEHVRLNELIEERSKSAERALVVAYETHEIALGRQRDEIRLALVSTEKAIDKADHATEKRFEAVNEFRATLTDQTRTFMPRAEVEARTESMALRLQDAVDRNVSRLSAAELAISVLPTRSELDRLHQIVSTLMTRHEVEQTIASLDERTRSFWDGSLVDRNALHDQVNKMAVVIERAAANGQTIYQLRTEAATMVKSLDDKIAVVASANNASHLTLTSALAELRNLIVSRREVEALVRTLEDRIERTQTVADEQHGLIRDQLSIQALAIERANVAGQTIYVLRSEAVAQAVATDDKIAGAIANGNAASTAATAALSELRAQVAAAAATYMPRTESETRTAANTERLREIEIRMQTLPTREEAAVALTAADAKFSSGIGSATEKTNALADRLAALDLRLTSRLDLSVGKGNGLNAAWLYAVAFIGVVATLVSIYAATKGA